MSARRGNASPTPPERALPTWLLAAWFLSGLLLILAAVFAIQRDKRHRREEWESRLSGLADDRLALVENWVAKWREETRVLSEAGSLRALVEPGREESLDPETPLRARRTLERVSSVDPGVAIGVVDAGGRLLASSGGEPPDARLLEAARRAREQGREVLLPSAVGQDLTLAVAQPIFGRREGPGAASGVILLSVQAVDSLGTLLRRTTVTRHVEETFLVARDGAEIVAIDPEHAGEPNATARIPANDQKHFASAALSGRPGLGEFTDARGRRVLAATRYLPEFGWGLAIQVDRERALGSATPRWIVLAAGALFVAVVAAGLGRRRLVALRHYRQISERDARYRQLLEQTQEAVAVQTEGRLAYANPACLEMFGYEDVPAGAHVTEFFAPAYRDQVAEIVRSRAAGLPAPELYEAQGLRADGATFDLEVRVMPVVFEGKRGAQAILRDITSRKRMEAELRHSEERYRLLFERNLAGVYRSTVPGRLLECNRAFAQIMGFASPAEAMAQPASAFHPSASSREEFLERMRREGSLVAFESQARRKDGSLVWIIENVSMIRGGDGEELLLGTVFDLTDRRRLEEQLVQSQKMEAVGRLAGGIAHDFNNLLTAIAGYSELLLGSLPEEDPRRESAEEIRKAGRRAASLTQQLLAFSRRQVLEPKVIDLNAILAGMEKMLRRLIGEDVELLTSTAPGLWRTRADPGQIEQAVLNLVVNARDAMPRGGSLTLETANVELDANFAKRYATVRPGPHVMLAVTDTGVGMDAETQALLFEPFFTTKERGKGTGLGLSTTYGIVKQSGGSIWVYSEPGVGTTFKIYLPRCEEPLDAPPPAAAAAALERGAGETILLVEDEEEVRRLIEKLLRMRGYTVLQAASPAEALALARREPGEIHALLTDVVMPGMNGRELARLLAGERPRIKVLFMSGYADAAVTRHGMLEPGSAFLSKPFAPDALARRLREVLDAPNLKSS